MHRLHRWAAVCGLLPGFAALCAAAEPPAPADRERARAALSALIDQHLDSARGRNNIVLAPRTDDAEFLRRVSLDLTGRIPREADVRRFLADTATDKRERIVSELLDTAAASNHLAALWRANIAPGTVGDPQRQALAGQLEQWLRRQIIDEVPYDRIARELLTAQVGFNRGQPFNAANPPPTAFYQLNEFKPENLAATTTRLFMGVKLECAQCHDHPFAPYGREQFWEFAAFFAPIKPAAPNNTFAAAPEEPSARTLKLPNTDKTVTAKFLDGTEPTWPEKAVTRQVLADWLTAKENPYFAKTAVNRVWTGLFGRGLRDPVDDPADVPTHHPELVADLAREFAENGYDLKWLTKAIVLTKTYQATSRRTDPSQDEWKWFARMPVRGLTAEQTFDSLVVATGFRDPNGAAGRQFVFAGSPRGDFMARFQSAERPTEATTSILQALTLMNGKLITDQTHAEKSEAFASVCDAPYLDTAGRIETLFLMTLGRQPKADEAKKLAEYVEKGGPTGDRKQALADVFWALLNSAEFRVNH